jgi:AcrR family transcriptional regulator
MSQGAFRRARRPEQKEQRREAILVAAQDLAARSGVRNVSLGSVASAVGLAKSNVARYFGTREEIYLELTARGWREWEAAVLERLRDATGREDVIDILTETLAERPLFCDLLSQCTTILEHNVSLEAARAFKRDAIRVVAEVGVAVAKADPGLTEGEGAELVGAAGGLATLLYPIANPPPVMAELYTNDPVIAAAGLDFVATTKRMLAAVAAGLPQLR